MKTLIQGGHVVGFDGKEHEIVKDGVVVFDGNRIEYVGKQYSQPVDKKIEAKGIKLTRGYQQKDKAMGNIGTALLTDPWGVSIELTEGLDKIS